MGGNRISVNSAFFTVVDAEALSGTGMNAVPKGGCSTFDCTFEGGGTGWLTVSAPVPSDGSEVEIEFEIFNRHDMLLPSVAPV